MVVERTVPLREEVLEKKTVIDEIVEIITRRLPEAVKDGNTELIKYYLAVLEGFIMQRNPNFANEFLELDISFAGKKMKMKDLKTIETGIPIYLRNFITYATAFLDRIKTVRQTLILDVTYVREVMEKVKQIYGEEIDEESEESVVVSD